MEQCRLLQLPGKIRNMIYRLVLCGRIAKMNPQHKTPVWISQGTIAQPSVLRTCAQIRAEASSIYYLENTFDVLCRGVDPANMIALTRQSKGYKISTEVHDYEAGPEWANAFKWLEAYHHGEVTRLNEVYNPCADEGLWNSVAKMFDMVDVMKQNGMLWEEAKKVLMLGRDLAALSEEWEWDAGWEVDEK